MLFLNCAYELDALQNGLQNGCTESTNTPGGVTKTCHGVCINYKKEIVSPIDMLSLSHDKVYVGVAGQSTLVGTCGPNNPQHWFYDHFWYHYKYMVDHPKSHILIDFSGKSCMEWSRDITLAVADHLKWSITAQDLSFSRVYCTEGDFVWLREHRVNHDNRGKSPGFEEVSVVDTSLLEDISRAVLVNMKLPQRSRKTNRPCRALIYTRQDCCRRQLYGVEKIATALAPDCHVEIVNRMPVSLKAQVELFVNTTIAIAWAGSWVMNYLWMPPEAKIIAPDVAYIHRPGPVDFGGWGHISEWHVPCFPPGTERSYVKCQDAADPLMVDTKVKGVDGNFSLIVTDATVQVIMEAVKGVAAPFRSTARLIQPTHYIPKCTTNPECMCKPDE